MNISPAKFRLLLLITVISVAVSALMIVGCGGSSRLGREVLNKDCALDRGSPVPGGVISVALDGGIDPVNIHHPVSGAESLVFRQLYETLIRVDCRGEIYGELAESWECDHENRTWIFTLRQGATFWDGSALGASDVVASWLWGRRQAILAGHPPSCSLLGPLASAIAILDERHLQITLPRPVPGFPRQLSWPHFAVSASRPDLVWRLGSGPLRPGSLYRIPEDEFALLPNRFYPEPASLEKLNFKVLSGDDPRNHIFRGVDAFLLQRADLLPWFQAVPELRVEDLAPEILYILLLPPESEFSARLERDSTWYGQLLGEIEAGGVLLGGGAVPDPDLLGDFLGSSALAADSTIPAVVTPEVPDRIYYPEGDRDAYNLAARIASLTGDGAPGKDPPPVVAPIPADQLSRKVSAAMMGGAEGVMVLPLRRGDPWRQAVGGVIRIPLALRNPFLVTRGELVGLYMDADGVPVLTWSGWSRDQSDGGGGP